MTKLAEWREDLAFSEFQSQKSVIQAITSSTSEADTRLRAINTLLFEVLKWEKTDVETERYCRAAGFADYLFSSNGSRGLILEAKKAGIFFVLPSHEFSSVRIWFARQGVSGSHGSATTSCWVRLESRLSVRGNFKWPPVVICTHICS